MATSSDVFRVIFLLVSLLSIAPNAISDTIKNNQELSRLIKSGLSDAVILQAIDNSNAVFDTSTDALIALKKNGASDAVVQRVLLKKASKPSSQESSAQSSNNARSGVADCGVKLMNPAAKIETQYSGECKDGMANGQGHYSESDFDKKTNKKIVKKVSGVFQNGTLNGFGMIVTSAGDWMVGVFQNGNRLNTTTVRSIDGVRIGYSYEAGNQVALCREDMEQPRCPSDLKKMLSLTSPPETLMALYRSANVQSNKVSRSGIQVIGSAPDVDAEWTADACGAEKSNSSTAIKVQYFDAMKAGDVNLPGTAAIPKTATVYPVEVTYKILISSSFDPNKEYMIGTRRGFVYKSAFGKTECASARTM